LYEYRCIIVMKQLNDHLWMFKNLWNCMRNSIVGCTIKSKTIGKAEKTNSTRYLPVSFVSYILQFTQYLISHVKLM
jgi:hypothetical protein